MNIVNENPSQIETNSENEDLDAKKHKKTKEFVEIASKPSKIDRLEKELIEDLPRLNVIEAHNEDNNVQQSDELSTDYRFTRSEELKEMTTIKDLIKRGENNQLAASKRLSVLKTLLINKKNKEISKNDVIYSEIKTRLIKIITDEKSSSYELNELKNFVKKRRIDKKLKVLFKDNIANMIKNLKNNQDIKGDLQKLIDITELKLNHNLNKNIEYEEMTKRLENTENDVENGKLYEAEENLNEIGDILKIKEKH